MSAGSAVTPSGSAPAHPAAAPLLAVRGLRKRFGGVVATDDVTLEVAEGRIHALIGPNGAGKTSLIAQLSGTLMPDDGEIRFAGVDVTRLVQHRRVKLGLARSFQITRLFRSFSAVENLAIAVQARDGRNLSFWRPVSRDMAIADEARTLLGEIGLSARADVPAAALSHGEQRALEVGVALATRPRLLLLDEPMAGTGPEESARMVELIERVRTKATVLLVEHDVDAVFRLADRVSVLVNGRVIASGLPDVVRNDPEVITAYLGDEVHR
jgi:branched-chain amino acid transport system ATP-binding protein